MLFWERAFNQFIVPKVVIRRVLTPAANWNSARTRVWFSFQGFILLLSTRAYVGIYTSRSIQWFAVHKVLSTLQLLEVINSIERSTKHAGRATLCACHPILVVDAFSMGMRWRAINKRHWEKAAQSKHREPIIQASWHDDVPLGLLCCRWWVC